jgi:hypothetical protein
MINQCKKCRDIDHYNSTRGKQDPEKINPWTKDKRGTE